MTLRQTSRGCGYGGYVRHEALGRGGPWPEPDSTPESSGPEHRQIDDEKVFGRGWRIGSRDLGSEEGRKIVKARPHILYEKGPAG